MSTRPQAPVKTWHTTAYPAIDPARPELSCAGKVIVITGGGAGIGLGIAQAFARASAAEILIVGRRQSVLESAKSGIEQAHPDCKVHIAAADIADEAQVAAAFAAVTRIDVLVNNAAYRSGLHTFNDAPLDDWWRGFEVNVKGSAIVAKEFLKLATKNAALINVTSGAAHVPPSPLLSSYQASKSAAVMLFQHIQFDNPELQVISVHPGVVETDMSISTNRTPEDDISLPSSYMVWAASPEAKFLKGKLVWAHWDVEELQARKSEIEGTTMLTLSLQGWPFK